ncbi:MAG: hypothetical protein WB802_10585 [Candidatus Dormiibacterota bacterium]|jgi:hypothetical protein
MKERAHELRAAARSPRRTGGADGEAEVLAKIAEMQGPDRAMAELSSGRYQFTDGWLFPGRLPSAEPPVRIALAG